MSDRSWVRRVLLGGDIDPDPRFSLANERTFLAWIRTSLTLVAAAVATDAVLADRWPDDVRTTIVVILLATGTVTSAGAGVRWLVVERALRRGQALPLSPLVPVLAIAVLVGAIGALGVTLWRL